MGSVRANAQAGKDLTAQTLDASSEQARQPVPLLQLLTRGDPPGGDDVRALSALPAQRGRPAVRGGIDICHETVRHWWNRFGPMFAADIRRQRVSRMCGFRHWRWHREEMC